MTATERSQYVEASIITPFESNEDTDGGTTTAREEVRKGTAQEKETPSNTGQKLLNPPDAVSQKPKEHVYDSAKGPPPSRYPAEIPSAPLQNSTPPPYSALLRFPGHSESWIRGEGPDTELLNHEEEDQASAQTTRRSPTNGYNAPRSRDAASVDPGNLPESHRPVDPSYQNGRNQMRRRREYGLEVHNDQDLESMPQEKEPPSSPQIGAKGNLPRQPEGASVTREHSPEGPLGPNLEWESPQGYSLTNNGPE